MMTMVLFVDWECPASSNIIKTSDLGALEGLDKYGRAFYKKFPVKSIVEAAMDGSHGIELGSRARLGTRPSGTWRGAYAPRGHCPAPWDRRGRPY